MSESKKRMLLSATILALSVAAIWPLAAHAKRGIGVSSNPDTKTHFIWLSVDSEKNRASEMMLLIQNGGSIYEVNVSSEVDVTFAKSDASQIKWCSYLATEQASTKGQKKCKPGMALKPGGEIKIP